MKYLCLICAEIVLEQMSEAEAEKHLQDYAVFNESIKKNGHYLTANRLKPRETATTLRVRNGRIMVSDGPFAETKEQIGGYYLIEARDLNEAISVAARIPGARIGCVELRPIADDAQTLALGFDAPYVSPNEVNT